MQPIENHRRVFVLTTPEQLPPDQVIWGTGGWLPPAEREAADWLILLKTLGWQGVPIYPQDLDHCLGSLRQWDTIIIACDLAQLPSESTSLLERSLASFPFFLIYRISDHDATELPESLVCSKGQRVAGQTLVWQGMSQKMFWACRSVLDATQLLPTTDSRVLATLDGQAIVVEKNYGAGRCVALGFHPSHAADQSGEATALLRRLLTCDPHVSHAWLDWSGTLLLRMDDPGGAV